VAFFVPLLPVFVMPAISDRTRFEAPAAEAVPPGLRVRSSFVFWGTASSSRSARQLLCWSRQSRYLRSSGLRFRMSRHANQENSVFLAVQAVSPESSTKILFFYTKIAKRLPLFLFICSVYFTEMQRDSMSEFKAIFFDCFVLHSIRP
jgi:hypothetical protein